MVHHPHYWTLSFPSNMDTCHELSSHWKNCLLVYTQTHHANCHCHKHNYSNRQIFNCSIEKNQQKSSTATIWYHRMQIIFQLDYIISNASSEIKSQRPPIFKLPSVSNPKPIEAPPRVSPYTTQYFHNISTTTLKHHRDPQAAKSKNYPKILPFISPSPKFKFNTCPSNY